MQYFLTKSYQSYQSKYILDVLAHYTLIRHVTLQFEYMHITYIHYTIPISMKTYEIGRLCNFAEGEGAIFFSQFEALSIE